MDIQGYFTAKGLALSAKLISGKTLEITRVAAGSGHTAKPASATALPQIQQELVVNTPTHSGSTAVIPATLVAAQARNSYSLTELGVYARDPDEGEILYKVYQLSDTADIVAGSRTVLRFYLEETVSQDLNVTVVCSPAGLITEEDFLPVRDKVLAKNLPIKEVSLEAGQLQAYLDALPRLVTENLILNVSGTLEGTLDLRDFYGNGQIRIAAANTSARWGIQGGIVCGNCSLTMLQFWNLDVESTEAGGQSLAVLSNCAYVLFSGCHFQGNGTQSGLAADYNTAVSLKDSSVASCKNALMAIRCARFDVSVSDADTAAQFTGNTTGGYVWHGGTILLSDRTPDLLGGSANTKSGGFIVKANGTLL